jgi:uncharacterized membrane protein YphA (DoxX/SURF4 family)
MLSLFPEVLFLAPFAALLLRVALAVFLALTAWAHMSRPEILARAWALVEIAAALALFVGAWTQAAALIASVWLFASLFVPQMRAFPSSTVLLAIVIALSLVVTGPGPYSLDLPL